jgi:hypothetical protein
MYVRLHATGAIAVGKFEFHIPITQIELSYAVGLSPVHVNRTLQSLRRDRLIGYQRSSIHIEDWPGLRKAGEFDATYLHLGATWPSQTHHV